MLKSKMRLLGVSALVGAGMLIANPADAAELRLGGVDISIDTIASVGLSVRVIDREDKLLSEGNGGPADVRTIAGTPAAGANPALAAIGLIDVSGTCGDFATFTNADLYGTTCARALAGDLVGDRTLGDNYDSSVNADDGRLNFDSGDLTSGTIKFSSDIEADLGRDLRAFARVTGFYDAVMADTNSFERSPVGGKQADEAEMDLRVLDLYVDYNTELLGAPLMIRAGKQVINWGESTFYLGGNSVFNAIDTSVLTRPGAEIKEAYLPIEAVYASLSVTDDLTVEAYAGGWSEFELVKGGTPFSNTDTADGTTDITRFTYIGGGPGAGGNKMNCVADDVPAGITHDLIDYMQGANSSLVDSMKDCTTATDAQHYAASAPVGQLEEWRSTYDDTSIIQRGQDDDDAGDNYGVALRYYSEALNSTEFGFYFQNYTSRIPYAQIRGTGAIVANNVVDETADAVNRILVNSGSSGLGLDSYCGSGAAATMGADYTLSIGNDASDKIKDPYGVFSTYQGFAASKDAANDAADYAPDTFQSLMNINCALSNGGGNANLRQALDAGSALNKSDIIGRTGEMFMTIAPTSELALQYPENIRVAGMSFNTTVLGWGVQGEIAYRDNMPLQIDTDSQTIATYSAACVFELFGTVGVVAYAPMKTIDQPCNTDNPGVTSGDGFVREEVINFDLGTTATFTRSNPIVSALGADLAILLTEFAYEYVPQMDEYRLPDADQTIDGVLVNTIDPVGRLANRCTSGSDLGLGGLVAMDERPDNYCRPTSASAAGLIFMSLQYNNVFGTAWSLSPTLIYREGIHGIGASPTGSVEGNSVTGLRLDASLQGKWNASLGYTNFGGSEQFNRNVDKDNVSISISYAY